MLTKLQSQVGSSAMIHRSASVNSRFPRRPVAAAYFMYVATPFSSTAQSRRHSGCRRSWAVSWNEGVDGKALSRRSIRSDSYSIPTSHVPSLEDPIMVDPLIEDKDELAGQDEGSDSQDCFSNGLGCQRSPRPLP